MVWTETRGLCALDTSLPCVRAKVASPRREEGKQTRKGEERLDPRSGARVEAGLLVVQRRTLQLFVSTQERLLLQRRFLADQLKPHGKKKKNPPRTIVRVCDGGGST